MTNDEPDDREPQAQYDPETDHFCDGYVEYTEDITLRLSGDESYDCIQHVEAECQVCGRDLMIVVDVGPDWLRTIDRDSQETLHEY